MNSDLLLVIGLALAVLSVPSMVSAFADSRRPRVGAVVLAIAGVLVATAFVLSPGGYSLADIPDAFLRVLARILN